MTVEVRARWILAKSNLEVLDIRISVVGGEGVSPHSPVFCDLADRVLLLEEGIVEWNYTYRP